MVLCSSIKRLSGGKTVKVDLEVINDLIKNVIISGDFFLYPEDYIHFIESRLRNVRINDVSKIMYEFKDSVEIVGASIDEFLEVINDAYRSCLSGG
ncbi:MAG: lipoate protein ligase C-terminal domain-containing protein [Sulfolobales archaeon]